MPKHWTHLIDQKKRPRFLELERREREQPDRRHSPPARPELPQPLTQEDHLQLIQLRQNVQQRSVYLPLDPETAARVHNEEQRHQKRHSILVNGGGLLYSGLFPAALSFWLFL